VGETTLSRIVVLASGSGTNLQALIDATQAGTLAGQVVGVVSNQPGAGALRRAAAAGIPAVLLPLPLADRHDTAARLAYDRRLADAVAVFEPDLVVLAGWMLVLSPAFLDRFPSRIVNVHPALLPEAGEATVPTSEGPQPTLRGARAVRDALRLRLPVTGATVHWVTPRVDAGPAILREEVAILPGDDEASLHARIKAVEHRILPRAVMLALERVRCESERTPALLDRSVDRGAGGSCRSKKGGDGVAGGDRPRLEVRSGAR